MSSRNLFRIILKVLGILMIQDLLVNAGQLVATVGNMLGASHGVYEDTLFGLLAMAILVAILVMLIWVLLFRTDSIIEKLKLDRGIEPHISLIPAEKKDEIDLRPIISMALLLIGIYMLVSEIPDLLKLLYERFEYRKFEDISKKIGASAVFSASRVLVAILLISNCNAITAFVEKTARNK